MTNLREIAAAFLDSLAGAQHEANLYSKQLAVKYREDPLLKYFPVPNGLLDEAEVTLHFMVPPTVENDGQTTPAALPVGVAPSRVAVADLAMAAGRALLRDLANALEHEHAGSGEREREHEHRHQHEQDHELAEALRSHRVARELAARLRDLMGDALTQAMHGMPMPQDELRAGLLDELEQSLGGSLSDACAPEDRTAFVRSRFSTVIDANWPALLRMIDAAAARQRDIQTETARLPALPVQLSAAALHGIPADLVQTLTLRAKLRNYKWVLIGEGEHEHDELIVME